jgi:uncharacterized protein YcfL
MKKIFVIPVIFTVLFFAVSCGSKNKTEKHKGAVLKEEVTKEISAEEGGTMTSSGDEISIEIPGNAVDSNVTITMRIYDSEGYKDTEGRDVISKVVEFEPSGTIFKKPVIISMTSLAKVDNKIIAAAVFNESKSTWSYSSSGAAVKIAGHDESGDPIMQSVAGDPIMLNAAGDPIMMNADGGEIMISAAGDPIMVTAAGDPIMMSAAGDPIMMTTGHFTAYTFIALDPEEETPADDSDIDIYDSDDNDIDDSDADNVEISDTEDIDDSDNTGNSDADNVEISDMDEIDDSDNAGYSDNDNIEISDLDEIDDSDNAGYSDNDYVEISDSDEINDSDGNDIDDPAICPEGFCNDGSCYTEKNTHKIYCACDNDAGYYISGSRYYDENPTGHCWYALAIDCSYDIGTAQPFIDKTIDGNHIYDKNHQLNDAETATWEWTLSKGPCDIVLEKTSFTIKAAKTLEELDGEGEETTVVSGVGLSQFKVKFKSSGSYILHLKVTRPNGEVYECEWILNVVSDGLRVELCWDKTGTVDLDLYLGKNGVSTAWKNSSSCYFQDCNGDPSSTKYNWNVGSWGYAATINYNQSGVVTENMKNPRLYENINTPGLAEDIYLDNPNDGDIFRVMANYYSTSGNTVTHPVVNVYCGGILKAVYGVEPQVSGFDSQGDSWKVVEIKWVGDYSSDACELTPNYVDDYVINQGAIPDYNNW